MSTWSNRLASLCLGAALLGLPACGARSELPVPDGVSQDDEDVDAQAKDCVAEGVTFIYVVTAENELLRFDPRNDSFSTIGRIACPDDGGSSPFSMGVDRKGTAYVAFHSGALYRVSTATAKCRATGFRRREQDGFTTFGMGFSTDGGGPGETLFVADASFGGVPSRGLGSIDTESFELSFVTPFSRSLGDAVELTGTGDGRLFGLFIDSTTNSARIAEIDKQSGEIGGETALPLGPTNAFAFAFWGGDFYVFHSNGESASIVTRLHPDDGSLVDVARLTTHVVGVGVSTCAPS